MTESDEQTCGEIKGNGEPCENPVKYADGKCGIHSEINGDTQGRPTKFSDKRARQALNAARIGKSKRGCERAAGVGEGTIDRWLEADREFEGDDGLIDSFAQAFAQARAKGETQCIRNARREDGNPAFEKYLLSSSFGYKKTEKQEHEHAGEDGGPIEVVIGGDDS